VNENRNEQSPSPSAPNVGAPPAQHILRHFWLLFLVVPVLLLLVYLLDPSALTILIAETRDLLLFVGLPIAGACWLIILLGRWRMRRTTKGILAFAFKSAVVILVSVVVVTFWLPALLGGGRVWSAGVVVRLKLTADVPAIRQWAQSQTVSFQNLYQDTYPPCIWGLRPYSVWVSADEHTAVLTLSDKGGNIELSVGPKGSPPPANPGWMQGIKPLKLEDGAYVWLKGSY
jgi:hypothetical protein